MCCLAAHRHLRCLATKSIKLQLQPTANRWTLLTCLRSLVPTFWSSHTYTHLPSTAHMGVASGSVELPCALAPVKVASAEGNLGSLTWLRYVTTLEKRKFVSIPDCYPKQPGSENAPNLPELLGDQELQLLILQLPQVLA